MLYKDRIKNLTSVFPALSRVWIKTDNPGTPLKGVWISEPALRNATKGHSCASCDMEAAELTEDHLLMAA